MEDIEDIFKNSNGEETERLQIDQVVARVRRRKVTTEVRSNAFDTYNGSGEIDNSIQSDSSESDDEDSSLADSCTPNVNKKLYRQQTKSKPKSSDCGGTCSCKKSTCFTKKNGVSKLNTSLPGRGRIFVKTWGCAHNNSDSEYMAGLLSSYGYMIVEKETDADLWLLNSCTVKSPAEQFFRNYIEQGQASGKHIVVAGCVSQSAPKTEYLHDVSIVGVQQIDRVVEVVEEALKGNTVRLLGVRVKRENNGSNIKTGKRLIKLNLPKIRRNQLIEIIAINVGCLNQCTYCKTKQARGDLASYPIKEIVERVIKTSKEGVKEFWLTSEDTGAYGKDLAKVRDYAFASFKQLPAENQVITTENLDLLDQIQPNIANLLRSVLSAMPLDCRLRLGMTNPPYVHEYLEDIADIMMNDERIYKFLHIPVQSGSDAVLNEMKREYNASDFVHIVEFMRSKVPGITIATDLILGFPTETEEDFEQTLDLIKKYKFPSLFINQYYPRPGTPAAKMKLIPPNQVRVRTKKASHFFKSYFPYENREGQKYRVLVTEVSSDGMYYVGHNQFYEQILVPKNDYFLGKIIDVIIEKTARFNMFGKPINQPSKLNLILHNVQGKVKKVSTNQLLFMAIATTSALILYRLKRLL